MMTRRILQVVALAFSLTLAGGFVYVKAGGAIPGLPFNQPAEQPPTPMVLSGSKSMIIEPSVLTPASSEPPGTPPLDD